MRRRERLLWTDKMVLGSALRGELTACHIRVDCFGRVDRAALSRAARATSESHLRLRSRIVAVPRLGPLETVYRFEEASPPDLAPIAAGEAALAFVDRPFDVFKGPLWRIGLEAHDDGGSSVHVAWHHALGDGVAGFAILGECLDRYRAAVGGPAAAPSARTDGPPALRTRPRLGALLREVPSLFRAARTSSRARPIRTVHRFEKRVRVPARASLSLHALALAAAARPLAERGIPSVAMPFNLRAALLRHRGIANVLYMVNTPVADLSRCHLGSERHRLAASALRRLERLDMPAFRIASAFIAAAPRFALRWMAGKTHRGARFLLSVLGAWPAKRLRDAAGGLTLGERARIVRVGGSVPLIAGIEHSLGVGVLGDEAVLTLTSDADAASAGESVALLEAIAAELLDLSGESARAP